MKITSFTTHLQKLEVVQHIKKNYMYHNTLTKITSFTKSQYLKDLFLCNFSHLYIICYSGARQAIYCHILGFKCIYPELSNFNFVIIKHSQLSFSYKYLIMTSHYSNNVVFTY
jgi:hypothetical protein